MAANARTATARKTTATRKKAAARPPRKTAVVVPEVEPDEDFDDEDDAAEAQEDEAEGHYVTAPLVGEEVRILPPAVWRQSWNRLLHAGLMDDFAAHVLHPDDLDLYFELDPTNAEFGTFIGEASEQAPESQGKSHGPNRSTRRTRRR